jgi:hypothetical protein
MDSAMQAMGHRCRDTPAKRPKNDAHQRRSAAVSDALIGTRIAQAEVMQALFPSPRQVLQEMRNDACILRRTWAATIMW